MTPDTVDVLGRVGPKAVLFYECDDTRSQFRA